MILSRFVALSASLTLKVSLFQVDGRTPESPHCAVPVGELSLSRPEELKQEFSVLQPEDGWGRGFVALQHGGPAGAAATSKL